MMGSEILVRVAHAAVATSGEVLVTLGLGSCVAVLLDDPEVRVAGMAHVLLPEPPLPTAEAPAKFASTAVPHLVERMERVGARSERLRARLVGGASMFGRLLAQGSAHTGERNILAARQALLGAGIPIVAEEVGEEHGRSVRFYPEDGRVVVSSYRRGQVVL
jgi:chemotaxis protein CheD